MERQIVDLEVAGSTPVSHPKRITHSHALSQIDLIRGVSVAQRLGGRDSGRLARQTRRADIQEGCVT